MAMARLILALLSLGARAFGQANGPNTLGYELKFVDTAKHPLAVCNDGSAAAYYLHKGDTASWVLHQQGGWWCWDAYSCGVRWAHFANHTTEKRTLMSTKALANLTSEHDTFNGEKNTGLMAHNASVNPMANASKVFLVYCSSDAHAGNRSAGKVDGRGDSTWHFRGKAIVAAVIAELAAEYHLADAKKFLLTGGSAGGMATIANADFVGGLVRAVAKDPTYVAMPDSGYFLDVEPGALCEKPGTYECLCAAGGATNRTPDGFNGADGHSWLGRGATLAQQAQAMQIYSDGVPNEDCAAKYGEWGAWKCYLGEYAAPHLRTTTLLLQNQIDEWQGFWNGFFAYATSKDAFAYATWFREQSSDRLARNAGENDAVHVFSPNCYHHGLAYDDIFWSVKVGEWSAASMLAALLEDRDEKAPFLVLDDCAGLPCSPATTGHADCETIVPPAN